MQNFKKYIFSNICLKTKCFKLCGCGSDGKCHYCNDEDFFGNNPSYINSNGPFGTNGMLCTSNAMVNKRFSVFKLNLLLFAHIPIRVSIYSG